jgi:hypothetical protein
VASSRSKNELSVGAYWKMRTANPTAIGLADQQAGEAHEGDDLADRDLSAPRARRPWHKWRRRDGGPRVSTVNRPQVSTGYCAASSRHDGAHGLHLEAKRA